MGGSGGTDRHSLSERSSSSRRKGVICTLVNTGLSLTARQPGSSLFPTLSNSPDRKSRLPGKSAMPCRLPWRPGLPTACLPCWRPKRKYVTDRFPTEKRSQIMANVKGWNTSPERVVKGCLRHLGCRFRSQANRLLGKPDIVLVGQSKLIFVNGCFWHGHKGCPRAGRPQTNKVFWRRKIEGNIKRDARILRELRKDGWKALVVWQCQTKDLARLERRLSRFIAR